MKTKIYLLMLLFAFMAINVNAQIKISNGGNVAIASSPTPNDYTKVGISFSSSNYYGGSHYNYAFCSANTPPTSTVLRAYGVFGSSWPSTQSDNIYSWGIYGQGGNGLNGYNYGVMGTFGGASGCYGAGIYGAARGMGFGSTGGNYAGYFNGNVYSTSNMYATSFIPTSDFRLKKEIMSVNSGTYEKISQLNAVSFKFKTKKELYADGTIPTDTVKSDTVDNKDINKIHYGYIAQDLQKVFPDLVYEQDNGILGINYIELIPLMLEAIKEQGKTITQLQSDLSECCKITDKSSLKSTEKNNTSETNTVAVLYQNTPNPFLKETQIKYYVPSESKIADIYVYNMQGTQLKKISVVNKENASIIIQGSELKAGMYMYTLIVDGKEIDTKKMILTE